MEDFKLQVLGSDDAGDGFRVKAQGATVGESAWEPVEGQHVRALRDASLALSHGGTADEVARLGDEIFATFFPDTVHDLFVGALRSRSEGIRILVVFPRQSAAAAELHQIAWETIRYDGLHLGQSCRTPIVRYHEQGRPVRDPAVEPPLRILLSAADALPHRPLDLEAEIATISRVVRRLDSEGSRIQLSVLRDASLAKLRRRYLDAKRQGRPFHVWHHCGHGRLSYGAFELAFADSAGHPDWVGVERLNPFLADGGDLRLAVLSVCHGSSWLGLASRLASLDVPWTAGYSAPAADEAIPGFMETFYGGLTNVPLDVAFNQAREELSHDADPAEWTKAILFSRTLSISPLLQEVPQEPSPHGPGTIKSRVDRIGRDLNAETNGGHIDSEVGEVVRDANLKA